MLIKHVILLFSLSKKLQSGLEIRENEITNFKDLEGNLKKKQGISDEKSALQFQFKTESCEYVVDKGLYSPPMGVIV